MMSSQEPKNRPRFTPEPTAVIAYSSDTGVHTLIVDSDDGKIRAACQCRLRSPNWRSGKDAYEQVKADWAEQHNGGAS